ncbi:MATE family efflux transporter [Maritimibacter sp. DP1N21-5]|uniref:MATE family efflux transporter n=1 Tax=Maritimibacter sp. DP1N21-5 TaxID=2836867 RepID=UPI001C497229|nr:MATE family efflux transporter [Maritimibacter sp. DP1N21-5]MBV7410302.1 MATE family efflux transporter [Maritimibacter sp. DP1N21-5]
MSSFATYRGHVRAHLTLGLPLVGSQLAQVAVQTTDTLMVGWYDVRALAALVLATSLYLILMIFFSGFAWAVTPLVAAAAEAGDNQRIRRATRMGLWLVLAGGVLCLPIFWFSAPLLRVLGQEADIADMAQTYLRIAGFGLIPALVVMTLKGYLSALEHTRVQFWVTVGAAVANAGLNWLLIFGNLGAPEMGIRGAALASLAVNALSALALAAYSLRVFPAHRLFQRLWRPDPSAFREVAGMGWQIGLTTVAEVGLFNFSSIIMGWIGAVALAAHGIALQVTTVAFMVQLGLSNAATVRAGRSMGRRDFTALRDGALSVWGLGFAFALVAVAVFLLFPDALVGAFVDPDDPLRPRILVIGGSLLAMAALFQVADSAQVMGISILRGMQDTRVPMLMAAFAYWGVGAPAMWVFGVLLGGGGIGVWVGLVLGLTVSAILLAFRFRRLVSTL